MLLYNSKNVWPCTIKKMWHLSWILLYCVYVLIEQWGGVLLYVKTAGRLAAKMLRAFQFEGMGWANWHTIYEGDIQTMHIAKLPLWMRKRKTSKVLLKQSLEKAHQRDWNNEGLLSEWDHESLKPCGKAGRWTHAAADHSSRTSHQDTIQSWQGC